MGIGGKTRVRAGLVIGLFLLSTIAYVDRTNFNIASVRIGPEFGLDNIHLGWIFSAFLLGYAAFQLPAGWFAARHGPRRALAYGLIWWSIFTAAICLVSPRYGSVLTQLLIVRLLLSAGEAIIFPGANQFIAFWIPTQERGLANGWVFAGVGTGAALAPPLITALMLAQGWRASFVLCAAVGLVAAPLWYLLARDRPEEHPRVSAAELAHIKAGIPALSVQQVAMPWRRMLASRSLWFLTLAYFTFGYIAFIFVNWFFIYLAQVRGLNLKATALYATLPFIAMIISCVAGGWISDWLVKHKSAYIGRCVFSSAALVLTAIFLALGSTAADTLVATLVLAGGAGSLYLSQNAYWAVSADFGGRHAGIVSGLMNMGCQIAGAITASLTPWIARGFGWNTAFYVASAAALLGAVAWLFVDPRRTLVSPEQMRVAD